MAIVGILLWWYTDGWKQLLRRIQARMVRWFDYFSIDILIRTLFAPFRQISAGRVDGSIDVQFHAFVDRLVSRMIGMFVRSIMIVIGIVAIVLAAVFGCVQVMAWMIVPSLPIVGLILTLLGWTPWPIR